MKCHIFVTVLFLAWDFSFAGNCGKLETTEGYTCLFVGFFVCKNRNRVLVTSGWFPNISLVIGQSSVNISLALRACDISFTTDLQPVIYWETNHFSELCQPTQILYNIGISETVLDINSEVVSNLKRMCYKQFNVPGSVKSRLFISEISLGGNRYFRYENGFMIEKKSWDKVFFSPNECPDVNNDTVEWTEINHASARVFSIQSSLICFKFQPSKKGVGLGGHIVGHKIRFVLTVDLAVCNFSAELRRPSFLRGANEHGQRDPKCQDLCSSSGPITNCPGSTSTTLQTRFSSTTTHPLPHTLSPVLQSSLPTLLTSSSKSEDLFSRSLFPVLKTTPSTAVPISSTTKSNGKTRKTTAPNALITVQRNTNLFTTTVARTIYNTTADRENGSAHFSSFTDAATVNEASTGSTKRYVTQSLSTKYLRNFSLSFRATDFTTERVSVKFETKNPNMVQYSANSTLHKGAKPEIPVTTSSAASSGKETMEDNKLFGLVDGLYILVGCVLMVLIVVIVSCCIFFYSFRIRKYRLQNHTDQECNTISSSQVKTLSESYDMPWRDNWLVRHHSTHLHDPIRDDDTISQSEKDMQTIHGNFVHQSNPELHLIHSGRSVPNERHDSIYDNAHYILRLNKDDLDAKVKDVIRKQRMLSITSYDSNYRPVQRRRAHTVSESSINSSPISDQVFECNHTTCPDDREQRYRRKCQRSSSAVSGSNLRCGRLVRPVGRRRTISQTSQTDNTVKDDSDILSRTNNLNNVSFRNRRAGSSSFSTDHQNITEESSLTYSNLKLTPQGDSTEEQKEDNKREETPTNLHKEEEAAWTVNAVYALVSQPHGASGTMQFKK